MNRRELLKSLVSLPLVPLAAGAMQPPKPPVAATAATPAPDPDRITVRVTSASTLKSSNPIFDQNDRCIGWVHTTQTY